MVLKNSSLACLNFKTLMDLKFFFFLREKRKKKPFIKPICSFFGKTIYIFCSFRKCETDPQKMVSPLLLVYSVEELFLPPSWHNTNLVMFPPVWHVKKRYSWFYSDDNVVEIQRIHSGVLWTAFWYHIQLHLKTTVQYSPMESWITVFSRSWLCTKLLFSVMFMLFWHKE